MALPFYNQADQAIWESGDKFIPQEQYRLNYTPSTTLASTVGNTGGVTGTQAALPYIWPPRGGGGGDGGPGGGLFGNLDMSKSKTFDKNVYSRDMINMSPMEAIDQGLTTPTNSWQNKQVQGFYNPTLGQYQTFEGKNINHLGLNPPSIAAMLFDKSFGKGPQIGDIEGLFTHGGKSAKDKIKKGWEEEKEKFKNIGVFKKWRENKAIKKAEKIEAHNLKVAQDAAAATAGPTGPQWRTSKGGQDTPGAEGQNVKSSSGDVYGGAAYGYNEAAEKSDYYAGGGRIGYRNGEFVDEDINIEGPGFDVNENVEMAETSPFEIRIEELMDEGMSWEEAYQIASQEFSSAEGQGDSFSEEGIASIV